MTRVNIAHEKLCYGVVIEGLNWCVGSRGLFTPMAQYERDPALDALPDLIRTAPASESSILAATATASVPTDRHHLAARQSRF
jgi:hypothetical protein